MILSTNETPRADQLQTKRLIAIDMLRGLVMVLMVLEHTLGSSLLVTHLPRLRIFKRIRPWRSRRVAQATPTKIFGVALYKIDSDTNW
jgi:hypothetical protein